MDLVTSGQKWVICCQKWVTFCRKLKFVFLKVWTFDGFCIGFDKKLMGFDGKWGGLGKGNLGKMLRQVRS